MIAGFLPLFHNELVNMITIPIFSGVIGYTTNWTGVWMLFYPVKFAGFRLPGLQALAGLLPRKLQQIPGVMQGGVGWQGIIPSRAAKMGSIAVDKGIAKVGGPAEFYEQLEPDAIAEHILESSRDDIREVVERTMQREHPQLWNDLPPQIREAVHTRVQNQLPEIVHDVTDEIGNNIDQLLDIKLMVIRHLEAQPALANRIFQETGRQELRFIINFGFFFGFILGLPTVAIVHFLPYWWVLPVLGTLVGWATNWLAIRMIFEPIEPRKIGPWTWQGLFLKRQKEAADVYAEVIADDIVTLRNIGQELLNGPRVGPHAPDDLHRAAPGRGPGHRARPGRGAGGRGHQGVRRHPRVGRGRGRGLHHDPADRPATSTAARARRCASSYRRECARCRPTTSPRCCARPCARTSGC